MVRLTALRLRPANRSCHHEGMKRSHRPQRQNDSMKTTLPQPRFTPHQLNALHYRLIAGQVELQPLRILASRSLIWQDWQISLHILGASHAVCLTRGSRVLTELLTCLPPVETPDALLTLNATSDRESCIEAGGLICRVHLYPFSLSDGVSLCHTPHENRMTLNFPSQETASTPITSIGWLGTEEHLLIETLHTYPEEGRGLRSLTRFLPSGGE